MSNASLSWNGGFQSAERKERPQPRPQRCVGNSVAIFRNWRVATIAMASFFFPLMLSAAPALSSFYCNPSVIKGSGTITCTVKLNAASTGGTTVSLSSNDLAVAVPATVTVPFNATSAQFQGTVSPVTSSQVSRLTATLGEGSMNLDLNLNAAVSTLTLSATALSFGSVAVDATSTQSVTLRSTGTEPLTISAATVTGSGFSVSGTAFPVTLNPSQTTTLLLQFAPTAAEAAAGQLTITSNDSSGKTAAVALSGEGLASPLSAFYCNPSVIKGSGSITCTVKLNGPSNSGTNVSLSSNDGAVAIPAKVIVPPNSTSVQFQGTVSAVTSSRVARLTAASGEGSMNLELNLNAAVSTLNVSAAALSFGNVAVNTTAAQSVTLRSTGTEPLTISAGAVTGSGFSVSGITFPVTLNPSQSATLTLQFAPVAAQAATGQLTITSNNSGGSASVILLSGAGTPFTGSPVIETVAPPSPSTAISSDFFGMTIYNLASRTAGDTIGLTAFPPYQLSALRLWDVDYWADMEPVEGQLDWVKMDGTVATGTNNGVSDFIFTFGQTPKWASSNPEDPCTNGEGPGTCSPPNLKAYESFATQVVQRYCGKVKYYEPWNEPNNPPFWDGTNAQLLTLTQSLYTIAKDPANCGCTNGKCSPNGGVNPNQVLLPPIASSDPGSVEWLDSYLASAGPTYPYADIATFHGYVWWGYQPETIVSVVDDLQQTLANHGLGNVPVWNTEASWGYDTAWSGNEQDQASWLMRSHVAEWVAGVSRFVWYAYDACDVGSLAVSASSSTPCSNSTGTVDQLTAAGQAYSTMQDWLLGASVNQCREYQSGLWACELQRPGGYDAWMLWSNGANLTVPVPQYMGLTVYRDWQDNVTSLPTVLTVSNMPVLLENFDLTPQLKRR